MSEGATPAGLILASPASGSGKTVVTLGLLRALARQGVRVVGAKAGPDYIDPAFHAAATGRPCPNLDPWAMRPETIASILHALAGEAELVLCEGVMGLFDGAASGEGSTADLAARTGWPVVLVVDVRAQGASAAAVVAGFARHRDDVEVAGVIFNRVAGPGHEALLRGAMAGHVPQVPVLGAVRRDAALALPERHLGLVQAQETDALDAFLERAAEASTAAVAVDALRGLARPAQPGPVTAASDDAPPLPPLGQRIAVARDAALAFAYDSVLEGWRAAGAEVIPFSPLAGEGPDAAADAVYLPGGYPEIHAGALASGGMGAGLRAAAARAAVVYGECGGYMVLGRGLEDAGGARHEMAGLLPLETSFADRRLHLGYRGARLEAAGPLGRPGMLFRGHEFHYATVRTEGPGAPLFTCRDTQDATLGPAGLIDGTVMGSFIHLIDRSGG